MASQLSEAAITSLLNFGILAMQYGGHRDVAMSNLIPLLLNSTEEAAKLAPAVAIKDGVDSGEAMKIVGQRLLALQEYLSTVPHDNNIALATVQNIVPPCVSAFLLLLRFGVRRYITGRIRRDDWAMLGTWLLALGMMIAMYINARKNHAGYHVWDMSFKEYRGFNLTFFCIEIIYGLCLYAIKIAFMIFFWDLSPIRSMRIALVVVFVITTMSITGGAFCIILQCKPVAYWNDPVGMKCLPLEKIWLATGVLTIAGDLALLFVPVPFVWRLKITLREKIIVIAMFLIGAFVCIASVERVVTTVKFVNDPDITYKVGISQLWAILEINLGIMVSCIPAMRSLVVRFMPRLIGYNNSAQPRSNPGDPPAIALEDLDASGDSSGKHSDQLREHKKREWLYKRDQRDRKWRIGVGLTSEDSKDEESILEAIRTVDSHEEIRTQGMSSRP